jgi:DNA polymerase III subunit alpha
MVVRLRKGHHDTPHLERLLRAVRVRPGNLDLYLELVGLEQVRRAIYKAGASLRVRYDEALIAEIEALVGPDSVRLLGQRGATMRVEAPAAATSSPQPPTRAVSPPVRTSDSELELAPSEDVDEE